MTVAGCLAQHGEGTAFARADLPEEVAAFGGNGENISFLRLVAPDLARREAGVLHRDIAQLDARAAARRVHELGQRVGQAAGADVVDREDRVRLAELPAAVDHLLRAALDLGVVALHRVEIERLDVRPRAHRRGGAAAHADEKTGAAQMNQQGSDGKRLLMRVLRPKAAEATRKHDRLVIAAVAVLEDAEVAAKVGPAELVVVRRGADRRLEHDVECRGDAARLAGLLTLPGLRRGGNAQVRHRIADQPGLGLGAAAGGALVADLAARAGGGAGKGRDRGGMVVRLALDHKMGLLPHVTVRVLLAGEESLRDAAFDYRGVVGVRHHGALRIRRVRVADHRKQRLRLALAVDDPVGVEDLVAAVLGVRLREHGELGVRRVATDRAVRTLEVLDLLVA